MSRTKTEERNRVFAEETAVVQAQLVLHDLMERRGWSRAELARAMGVSRARVTQIFSDECTNLTVRLLARALFAFGEEFTLALASERLGDDGAAHFSKTSDSDAIGSSKDWVSIDDYSPNPVEIANDNIFAGLASLRRLREEGYELAA